jgi:hypothetical protein
MALGQLMTAAAAAGPHYIALAWATQKTPLSTVPLLFGVNSLLQKLFTVPLPSNGHLFLFDYLRFQLSCHIVVSAYVAEEMCLPRSA